MGIKIALVEDDPDFSYLSTLMLEEEGFGVMPFSTGDEFVARIQKDPEGFDLVLSDYRLPDVDGLNLYKIVKQQGLQCPFLLMTAFGDFDIAVEALKAGIADYLIKPVEKEVLVKKVGAYLERRSLEEEVLLNRLGKKIVAQSAVMQGILLKLSRLAKSKASILLQGESGTGKEVLAQMLHATSGRSDNRFVAVNVSAIPDTLFEAEFFGYRKGAFTDALRDHEGYARLAQDGTLFLDEVGELSAASQAKLLRLLEEKKVQPLGSKEVHSVDFRLIAATNRDLPSFVKEGRFRDDLFYRIAVIVVQVPPLRERKEDIIPLARYMLKELSNQEGLEVMDFTPQAQEKLISYSWPGNVRELKNRIHEALLATDERWIDNHHLHSLGDVQVIESSLSYDDAKSHFEIGYITRLLRAFSGNVNKVAQISGLSRKAVYDLMKRHRIVPEGYRQRVAIKE
jgi:DNA-binding NtrC family response regulator